MKAFLVAGLLLSVSGTAVAQAVSDLNGKLDFSAGNFDGWDGKTISASAAGPLTTNLGWQGDAMWARVSGQDFYGLGGQVFWRDPERALFGVTGSGFQRDGVDSYQFGIEAEYYLTRFTLSGAAGYAEIEYDQPVGFIDTHPQGSYLTAEARYYLTDNLALSVGGLRALDNNLGIVSVEYQTPIRGLSLFATTAKGNNAYDHTLAGIRYYFGKPNSLKTRHRRDDPQNSTATNFWTLGTYGAEYNRKLASYVGSGTDFLSTYGSETTLYTSYSYGVTFTNPFTDAYIETLTEYVPQ